MFTCSKQSQILLKITYVANCLGSNNFKNEKFLKVTYQTRDITGTMWLNQEMAAGYISFIPIQLILVLGKVLIYHMDCINRTTFIYHEDNSVIVNKRRNILQSTVNGIPQDFHRRSKSPAAKIDFQVTYYFMPEFKKWILIHLIDKKFLDILIKRISFYSC